MPRRAGREPRTPPVLDPAWIWFDSRSGPDRGTVIEAAAQSEVVILAIPYGVYREMERSLVAGRIGVDTTNYFAERDGHILDLDDGSTTSGRLAIPVAGDDPVATEIVAGLIDDMGFDAILTGPLVTGGRAQQPISPVLNARASAGYVWSARDREQTPCRSDDSTRHRAGDTGDRRRIVADACSDSSSGSV